MHQAKNIYSPLLELPALDLRHGSRDPASIKSKGGWVFILLNVLFLFL